MNDHLEGKQPDSYLDLLTMGQLTTYKSRDDPPSTQVILVVKIRPLEEGWLMMINLAGTSEPPTILKITGQFSFQ